LFSLCFFGETGQAGEQLSDDGDSENDANDDMMI